MSFSWGESRDGWVWLTETLETPVGSGLQIPPGTDADVTDATSVPAAEGAPAEEAEKEMEAALPAGEAASLEEPKIETETAEVPESDRCQPEEKEAAAPQVSARWRGGAGEMCPGNALPIG